ncbi:MAG: peptidoglycan glycosyltransferase [Clostridia bacterium]|nr:peptidoglycan glycosyltransferase [Clostridia bacterium]
MNYLGAALEQQNTSRKIGSKRGTIYDSSGKNILAISSTVYTVTVNPMKIENSKKESLASILSEIFELDYEKTLKKINKNTGTENIVKRQDKDKTDKLRLWMEKNNIFNGINIDEDTKRYYPYSILASHVIGFCGSDNQGLDGIEAKYDDVLKGKFGKINSLTDAKGRSFGEEGETLEEPKMGKSLILSIDVNIQSIVQKYLEEACIDNKCTDGGSIIAINPKNGNILALANYPWYNLNEPYKISDNQVENLWDSMDQSQKSNALMAMWRNKAIADTYEPGSTFKLVTASASLEEGIAEVDKKGAFACTGSIEIAGVRIKCWRYYRPHGGESLREALMNSCNPVFIGLGQKIGVERYYSYLEKFGFLKKTGIDLPGEASSIFLKQGSVGPVELATISFGQRFEVTPLQMITMVSTIGNKGRYVKPRIVIGEKNEETGEILEYEPQYGEQVISEETANNVLSMMESVVSEGTGKNAKVIGYRIGGKTGTSEDGVNTGKYVTSFVGIAEVDNPEFAILITLYNPTGEGGHQGGGVAAPIGGQIFSEVLPYLEVIQGNQEEVSVQNVSEL